MSKSNDQQIYHFPRTGWRIFNLLEGGYLATNWTKERESDTFQALKPLI